MNRNCSAVISQEFSPWGSHFVCVFAAVLSEMPVVSFGDKPRKKISRGLQIAGRRPRKCEELAANFHVLVNLDLTDRTGKLLTSFVSIKAQMGKRNRLICAAFH